MRWFFDMGVNGFDGDTEARLQAELLPSPKTGKENNKCGLRICSS
jgi:hypothetical protein